MTFSQLTSTLKKFTSILAVKSIQMTYSLKALHPWFSVFTCSNDETLGHQNDIIQHGREYKISAVTKTSETSFFKDKMTKY